MISKSIQTHNVKNDEDKRILNLTKGHVIKIIHSQRFFFRKIKIIMDCLNFCNIFFLLYIWYIQTHVRCT